MATDLLVDMTDEEREHHELMKEMRTKKSKDPQLLQQMLNTSNSLLTGLGSRDPGQNRQRHEVYRHPSTLLDLVLCQVDPRTS